MSQKKHHEWQRQKHKKHRRLFAFSTLVAVVFIIFAFLLIGLEDKRWSEKAINCNEDGILLNFNDSLNELDSILENAYEHKREIREGFNTAIVEKVKNRNWYDAEITAQISITMPEELAAHLKKENLRVFQTTGGTTFFFEHKFKAQEEKAFEYGFDKRLSDEEIASIKFSITQHALLPFTRDKVREGFRQGLMEDESMKCINRAILKCNNAYMSNGNEKIEIKGRINGELCSVVYSSGKKVYSCKIPFRAYPGRWKADEVLRFCREETKYTGRVFLTP
jgi:hypothetical protein